MWQGALCNVTFIDLEVGLGCLLGSHLKLKPNSVSQVDVGRVIGSGFGCWVWVWTQSWERGREEGKRHGPGLHDLGLRDHARARAARPRVVRPRASQADGGCLASDARGERDREWKRKERERRGDKREQEEKERSWQWLSGVVEAVDGGRWARA